MPNNPPEKSQLSDKKLDELYDQIHQADQNESVDEEVHRARAALNMIERVRNAAKNETAKTGETLATDADSKIVEASDVDALLPNNIGRFEIKCILGEGGFGMVLLAHDPNLGRDVALKIPRPEVITTPDLKSRFLREGRAAAALAHPNIVPVYESGQIGSICYLASHYVEGETLSQWISNRQQPVSINDAVEICQAISEALAHAHQRGVLHRDIKPSNVMVKKPVSDERIGDRIQITDFGLAKNMSEDSEHTRTGALIGTPSYMSPEQASQIVATQSSDIYSAGTVLFELLTGKPPFVGENIVSTLQAVINASPQSPRKLNQHVPADLEAICLKCLEKQPAARYSTAIELRSDLERFRNGEPVKARNVTAVTRVAKWLARNRLAASLLVVLAAGITGTTVGMVRAWDAEAEARSAEADAKLEAKTAMRVSDFMVDLFEIPDSTRTGKGSLRGKEVTAEAILDQGTDKIRRNLDDDPEIQARLMATIGRVYNNMGLYDQAETNLKDAIALQKEVLNANDPDLARTLIQLGILFRRKGQADEAVNQIDQAIKILDQDIDTNHGDLARAYNEIGLLLKNSDADAARNAYQQARDLIATFKGVEHASLWQLDANLAGMDARAGRYENARDAFERALEGGTRLLGEDNPRLGSIMNNLAFVHRKMGNYQLSLVLQTKDAELIEKHLGPDHPQMFGALSGLATTCKRLGDFDSAKRHGARAVAVTKKSLPAKHRYVWMALNNYADTLSRSGDFTEACQQLEKVTECLNLRDDDVVEFNRLSSLNLLCRTERLAGNGNAALDVSNLALAHPQLEENRSIAFETRINHAQLFAFLDRGDAEAALDDAISSAEGSNVSLQTLTYGEARFWALAGDSEQALTKLEEAFDLGYRDIYALTDPDFESIRNAPRFVEITAKLDTVVNGHAP